MRDCGPLIQTVAFISPISELAPIASSDPENQPQRHAFSIGCARKTGAALRHRHRINYVDGTRRFILVHHKRLPQNLGAAKVEAFLTYLAVARNVAASTQNQTKSALLFLYGEVLKLELPWLDEVITARTQHKLPVVLTPTEVRALHLADHGAVRELDDSVARSNGAPQTCARR